MDGVSMEEFGPVSLDYFTQQRVVKVTDNGEGAEFSGSGDAVWSIYFEGGGIIHNFDPTLPKPKTIVGAALTMVIMGLHKSEIDRTPVTELRFGLEAVQLNPLEYAMVDPNYTKGQLVYAQRSNANMPMLARHPDERVADGPEEGTDVADTNAE